MTFESMLGDEPETPAERRARERAARRAEIMKPLPIERHRGMSDAQLIARASGGDTVIEERLFYQPCTIAFLSRVLGHSEATVARRLRRVEPIGFSKGSRASPLYDFRTVLPFIIKSQMDTVTLLETLNGTDLPPIVNKMFWEGKLVKLKFEMAAGQAWSTEDVIEVLGRVGMTIKDRTKLWMSELREQCKGMSGPEVLAALQEHVDAYQAALHSDLVDMPRQRQTRSKLAEAELEQIEPDADDPE